MKVEYAKWITREMVRANPDKLFLFGDNLEHRGFGGQAKEMRGEKNAIGIPTKKSPSMDDASFFRDDQFEATKKIIDGYFYRIYRRGLEAKRNGGELTVVIPSDGIGTGLAQLDKRAPKTFEHLQNRLTELKFLER